MIVLLRQVYCFCSHDLFPIASLLGFFVGFRILTGDKLNYSWGLGVKRSGLVGF